VTNSKAEQTSTPTRIRILEEASKLFTRYGFHGTSTRDIAAAVGVRQPTLFHHFPSKQAILALLLDLDLDRLNQRLRIIEAADAPWPVKLHCHLVLDVLHIIDLPYDVRGLYNEEVLHEQDFVSQRAKLDRAHGQLRALVKGGVQTGDFIAVDPQFVRELISSAVIGVMWTRGASPSMRLAGRADELADFILRAVLSQPRRLPTIKRESQRLQMAVGDLLPEADVTQEPI
jgi:AcrR family transcriptional regulator